MAERLHVSHFVPGGILETDRCHVGTDDGTCSRCNRPVPWDQVPMHLFANEGPYMLTYCDECRDVRKSNGGE